MNLFLEFFLQSVAKLALIGIRRQPKVELDSAHDCQDKKQARRKKTDADSQGGRLYLTVIC